MAGRRASARAAGGPEPYPGGGTVGDAAGARREDPRDGPARRPGQAHGRHRASNGGPPPGPRHDPRPHPRHHPDPYACQPRRQREPPTARARPGSRRIPPPARRPLIAGRQRRPAGRAAHQTAHRAGDTDHPQRARGRLRRPLRPLRPTAPAHQHPAPRVRGRCALAGARARGRARQLAPSRHPRRVRARQGARRGAARARHDDPALHVPPGHGAAAMGRGPAQPVTRATFSRWIFFIAPFRRAKGSEASEPRSTNACR